MNLCNIMINLVNRGVIKLIDNMEPERIKMRTLARKLKLYLNIPVSTNFSRTTIILPLKAEDRKKQKVNK